MNEIKDGRQAFSGSANLGPLDFSMYLENVVAVILWLETNYLCISCTIIHMLTYICKCGQFLAKICTHNHTSIWNNGSKFGNDMTYIYDFINNDPSWSSD